MQAADDHLPAAAFEELPELGRLAGVLGRDEEAGHDDSRVLEGAGKVEGSALADGESRGLPARCTMEPSRMTGLRGSGCYSSHVPRSRGPAPAMD